MAQQPRQLATPTYLVVFLLTFVSLVNTLLQFGAPHASDPRWRFGAFGLFTAGMMLPVVGLLLGLFAATYFDHRGAQKLFGGVAVALAVFVLLGLGMFALDTLQVRNAVKSTAKTAFEVMSVTGALQAGVYVVILLAIGWAAFRAPKTARAAREQQRTTGGGLLIGAQQPAARRAPPPIVARPDVTTLPKVEPATAEETT